MPFEAKSLWGCTKARISSHVPGPHNVEKSRPCLCFRVTPSASKEKLSVQDLRKFKKRSYEIQGNLPQKSQNCNIKEFLWVHWQAQWHSKWLRGSNPFQHNDSTLLESTPCCHFGPLQLNLSTKPQVCINHLKISVYGLSYFATLKPFLHVEFTFLDCWIQISRSSNIQQNSWLQTLDWCINYSIGNRLKLEYFLFAHFFFNAHLWMTVR